MRKLKRISDYEVIRGVVLDILLLKEAVKPQWGSQSEPVHTFDNLVAGVVQVLLRRNHPFEQVHLASGDDRLEDSDVELVRDVFWDLFRQGADSGRSRSRFRTDGDHRSEVKAITNPA